MSRCAGIEPARHKSTGYGPRGTAPSQHAGTG